MGKGALMPAWMEILINVIGYAGFIGIATYHKLAKQQIAGPLSAERLRASVRLVRLAGGADQPSALTSRGRFPACGRNEKLMTTKARQNSRPTTITRRWVGLSAL